MYVSQQISAEVKAEVELKWTESPSAPPELHKGFSLIYIPRLKDKVWELPITHGVAADDLKAGMGHYPESEMPGEAGNFALAGHRSTYGEPLAYIDQLQQDDEVIIKTSENWYVYKLVLDAIVEPDEIWVLDDNPAGIVNRTGVSEVITITTCDPRWGSTHRWIWWGQLTAVLPIEETPEAITANQEGAA
jgi:LPXTG-site transpeptidase (sortase) family protein